MYNLGITEVCGFKGTGKTTYAISKLQNKKSMIFYSKNFSTKKILRFYNINDTKCSLLNHQEALQKNLQTNCPKCDMLKNITLKFIESLDDLIEGLNFVDMYDLIIIDTFDTLCLTKEYLCLRQSIYNTVQKLKMLSYKRNIEVLVLNECYNNNMEYNMILKYEWLYLVNRRVILRVKDGVQNVEVIDAYPKLA